MQHCDKILGGRAGSDSIKMIGNYSIHAHIGQEGGALISCGEAAHAAVSKNLGRVRPECKNYRRDLG